MRRPLVSPRTCVPEPPSRYLTARILSRVGANLCDVKTQEITDAASLPARPSIDQAAAYLNVSGRTVRRLIASGDLKAQRIGKRLLRIERASLLALAGE
jgi:excisionase family DNA binding protein